MGTATDPGVRQLLAAYQRVLDKVADLRSVVLIRSNHPGAGVSRRLHTFPRPCWPLGYFVIRHIDRTLQSVVRRLKARDALGLASSSHEADVRVVEQFRESLPPLPLRLYTTGAIIAGLVVASFLVDRGGAALVSLAAAGQQAVDRPPALENVFTKLRGAVSSLDAASANTAFEALLQGDPLLLALVALVLALDVYVVLRPLVPAFRLKRMLFNLGRNLDLVNGVPLRWSRARTTGLYRLEAEVLGSLGLRPPKERPFDLIVPGLVMALPLYVGVVAITEQHAVVPGALALGVASLRLAWLGHTGCRRRRDDPSAPFEVRIRNTNTVAVIRNPVFVATMFVLPFAALAASYLIPPTVVAEAESEPAIVVTEAESGWRFNLLRWKLTVGPDDIFTLIGVLLLLVVVYGAVFGYRLNRELSHFGEASGVKLGRFPLVAAVPWGCAPLFLWAASVSVYRTARRIRTAQRAAGLSPALRRPALVLVCYLMFPPLVPGYLQAQLNRLWRMVGDPLPDALWRGAPAAVTDGALSSVPAAGARLRPTEFGPPGGRRHRTTSHSTPSLRPGDVPGPCGPAPGR